ncbi:Sulfite exporter TauE/SafE [Geoglobus ahangari]|uniref:Probable membrane transporter protein n=1 Tax=Geoglobus ahangari TaxID=113653 RepID=A0A0F7IFS2_9EURY|nr:sulfite exporter TauE/SafE family protein [Geoglobus ahangari]AKG90669.1 Sulfite exporter TauE/SafE [Geoglobus ahangari]
MYEVLGLIVGFLVGLTGIGGGALMTPALLMLGVGIERAVGTDLAYAFTVKSFSSLLHKRGSNFDIRLFYTTAPPGVAGVLLGYFMLRDKLVDSTALVIILGAVLFTVSILMIYSGLRHRVKAECFACEKYCESFHESDSRWWAIACVAFAVGVLVQLTSVGSGTLMTFAILNLTNLRPNRVVGTDLVTSTVLSGVALLSHGSLGNVDTQLAARLIIPGLVGAYAGYCTSKRCSPGVLKMAISACIALASLTLIAGKV